MRELLGKCLKIMDTENVPRDWQVSVLVSIYQNKWDMVDCNNYRETELMSNTPKRLEKGSKDKQEVKVNILGID